MTELEIRIIAYKRELVEMLKKGHKYRDIIVVLRIKYRLKSENNKLKDNS